MNWLPDWQALLALGGVLSLGSLVGVVLGVPWIVARLPQDYFTRAQRRSWRAGPQAPWYATVLTLAKNVLGLILVALGLLMLVTPGQGVLTLVAGILLMNFPGKYQLERWLVSRGGVMRALNWLRRSRGLVPFDPPRSE